MFLSIQRKAQRKHHSGSDHTTTATPLYHDPPIHPQPTLSQMDIARAAAATTKLSRRPSQSSRVFISYHAEDSDNVFTILLSVLSSQGVKVFDPFTDLAHPSKAEMAAAVGASKLMIAVLSPNYFASEFCCVEARAAQEAGITIIPVYDANKWSHLIMTWRDQDTATSDQSLRRAVYATNIVPVVYTPNQAGTIQTFFEKIDQRCPGVLPPKSTRSEYHNPRAFQHRLAPQPSTHLHPFTWLPCP